MLVLWVVWELLEGIEDLKSGFSVFFFFFLSPGLNFCFAAYPTSLSLSHAICSRRLVRQPAWEVVIHIWQSKGWVATVPTFSCPFPVFLLPQFPGLPPVSPTGHFFPSPNHCPPFSCHLNCPPLLSPSCIRAKPANPTAPISLTK